MRVRSYKERAKLFHDKQILRKVFALGIKILLSDSKLHLFSGKEVPTDKSLYCFTCCPYRTGKILDLDRGAKFKVNGQ